MRSHAATQSPAGFANQHLTRPGIRTRLNDSGYRYAIHPAETAATLTEGDLTFGFDPCEARRYGAAFDQATDDTAAIETAIDVAKQTVANGVGNRVLLPLGSAVLSDVVALPNNVALRGTNKNGSILKADAAHPGPFMMVADNGGISMFDSLLEDVTVDCANVSGLSAIASDAWQNNCGPRRCLIYRFTEYGILFRQAGYALSGGADILIIEDTEIFGSDTEMPIAGVKVEQVSAVGNCVLHMNRCVVAGSVGFELPRGVDIVKDSSVLNKVHFEQCESGIYLDGVGSHVIINCAGADTCETLVEIAATFTGTVQMIGCRRGGATNFLKDNRAGGFGTLTGADPPHLLIGKGNRALIADNVVHAWCVFDGTAAGTNAPTRGHNVVSVTRNSVGDYTANFEWPLRNATALLVPVGLANVGDGYRICDKGFGLTTANFTVRRDGGFAGALADLSPVGFAVIGLGG